MTNADCSSADIRTAFLAIARILLASFYYIDNFERPYLSQFSKFWKNSLNTSNLCGIMNKSLNYNFMIGFFNFTYFQKFNIFCSDFADGQLRRACARPKTPAQSRWLMPSRVNIFRQKRRRFWNWVAQSAFLIIGSLVIVSLLITYYCVILWFKEHFEYFDLRNIVIHRIFWFI